MNLQLAVEPEFLKAREAPRICSVYGTEKDVRRYPVRLSVAGKNEVRVIAMPFSPEGWALWQYRYPPSNAFQVTAVYIAWYVMVAWAMACGLSGPDAAIYHLIGFGIAAVLALTCYSIWDAKHRRKFTKPPWKFCISAFIESDRNNHPHKVAIRFPKEAIDVYSAYQTAYLEWQQRMEQERLPPANDEWTEQINGQWDEAPPTGP